MGSLSSHYNEGFEHQILPETREDDVSIHITTHPLVQYDSLINVYIINLGNNTKAEVYGDSSQVAFQLADMWYDYLMFLGNED